MALVEASPLEERPKRQFLGGLLHGHGGGHGGNYGN